MAPYFDDDGTEVAPDMYPKPGLCLICKKLEDANEIMLCNLNRIDQRKERDFKCGAFDPIEKQRSSF